VVSEQICLDIVRALHSRTTVMTRTLNLDDSRDPVTERSEEKHALSDRDLVRPLLAKYELADVDAALRWLQLGDYIGRTEWGLRGPWVHVLTPKGIIVADVARFPDEDRTMFYREEPHQVFLAHQFREEDADFEKKIRDTLGRAGYSVVDGRVDGLEQFRHAILAKIRKSRFFLCLLPHRSRLDDGGYVSSVWLYQEIGAAVAMGKSPLLLVQDGMDAHFAGELQKTYEYIQFTPEAFDANMAEVIRRFDVDLELYAIPLPTGRTSTAV
jgi:hypothetical protein